MAQTTVLKVGMSCQGCVGAVKRVLTKLEGVESFDVDIDQQKVTVIGNVEPSVVFEKVSKTGKKTEYWAVEAETKEAPAPAPAPSEAPAVAPAHTTEAAPVDAPPAAPTPEAAPAETAATGKKTEYWAVEAETKEAPAPAPAPSEAPAVAPAHTTEAAPVDAPPAAPTPEAAPAETAAAAAV